MSDTRLDGMVQAHHVLTEYAQSLPLPKWWQIGRARYHKMSALSELSDRLYRDITIMQSEMLNDLLRQCGEKP